jgi:predicted porin
VGFSYDINRWTLSSEVLNLRGEDRNFSNDADGYYISAAYQFKNISPYIMIGEYHNRFSDDVKNKVIASEALIPVSANPALDGLRAQTITTFDFFNVAQETITLGVRYDFHPKADFKFEVEYFHFLNGSYGNMYPDDISDKGRDTVLTSFVIDVVF